MEVAAVGAIVVHDNCLLLVKRGHPPSRGLWSLPGGHVEPGESGPAAVAREVLEETSLSVEVGDLAGDVLRPGLGAVVYRILDYVARVVGGPGMPDADGKRRPIAGDDADDAAWVPLARLGEYPLTDGLVEALRSWKIVR